DGDVLAALHLDFGLRRRFGFLGLRAECAGAHDGEPDRDGRHSCDVHASPCNAVSVPRKANEGPSRSSALSRLSVVAPAQRTGTTPLTVGALRLAGCAVLYN